MKFSKMVLGIAVVAIAGVVLASSDALAGSKDKIQSLSRGDISDAANKGAMADIMKGGKTIGHCCSGTQASSCGAAACK